MLWIVLGPESIITLNCNKICDWSVCGMTVSKCIQQNYSEIVSIKIKDKYIAYFKRDANGALEILIYLVH